MTKQLTKREVVTKKTPPATTKMPKMLVFDHAVDIGFSTDDQLRARKLAGVYADHRRSSAILLHRVKGMVTFVARLEDGAFQVHHQPEVAFDKTYKPIVDYPVERAARLFVEYARHLTATKEAMDALATLVMVSTAELTAATKALKSKAIVVETPQKDKSSTETVAKICQGSKVDKPANKKETAASLFRELIMAGKLSDDQIFVAVQKQFGLQEKCRSHVSWYRNDLRKKGMTVPPKVK